MFNDTPQTPNAAPTRGPQPGAPIAPISTGNRPVPMVSTMISPERTPTLPPLPSAQQLSQQPHRGGKGKKILLFVALAIVLLGGGIAVAAFFFPPTSVNSNDNTNLNTNALSGLNTNATNLNRANTNKSVTTNATNISTFNTNAATNANTNTSFNANVTNATSNANTVTNQTSNTNTTTSNTNAVTGAPTSYSLDADGDKLNDYLEGWLKTSKNNTDSDGDGFPDGSEVTKSFSPLSTGKMTAAGLQSYCTTSTVVTQYKFSSTDATTFCKIDADILANIQVMATNAQYFQDLDVQLANSCKAFGKIDTDTCESILPVIFSSYLLSNAQS